MYDCYLPHARGWQGTFDSAQGVKRNGGSAAEIKSACELPKAKDQRPLLSRKVFDFILFQTCLSQLFRTS
jgi:hypothetical protein